MDERRQGYDLAAIFAANTNEPVDVRGEYRRPGQPIFIAESAYQLGREGIIPTTDGLIRAFGETGPDDHARGLEDRKIAKLAERSSYRAPVVPTSGTVVDLFVDA